MMPHQSRRGPRNSSSQNAQQNTAFLASQSSNCCVHHTLPHTPLLGISESTCFPNVHQFISQNGASTTALSETDELSLNVVTKKKWVNFSTNPLFTYWDDLQNICDYYGTGHGNRIPASPPSPQMPQRMQYVCWQHGCKGRTFTTLSNYRRHCKERSWEYTRPQCPLCGQKFLREAARDAHYNQQRCRAAGIDANGNYVWASMDLDNTLWIL